MEQASSARSDRRTSRKRALLIAAIAVACFAAAVAVLLLTTNDGDDEGEEATGIQVGRPSILSEEKLRAFGRDQVVPVYWAGRRPDTEYELTRTDDGRVFVRYLPAGASAGDPRPRFLTVASYAQPNAYRFLRAQSRRRGWTGTTTRSGALVANSESRPTSVYFAFENADLQVEVYDPDLGQARRLVLDGEIVRLR